MERVKPGHIPHDPGLLIQHLERYIFALNWCGWVPILDAACGCGYGASILSMVASKIVGLDKSPEAIDESKKLFYYCDSNIMQCDLETQIPIFNSKFQIITSFETIEHLENPDFFLNNCANLLEDEGTFIFSIPRTGITPWHKKVFTEWNQAKNLIEKHFKIVRAYGQNQQVGDIKLEDAPFWFGVCKKL